MAPSRKNTQATQAELSLVQLQKCFVNLPSSLVNILLNVDTPIQNVVIELNYRAAAAPPPRPDSSSPSSSSVQRSIFVGWTGMPSRRKTAALVGRGAGGGGGGRDQEINVVEIDSTFAHTLGLHDGQRVAATIHLDPPLAHTIHIEPLTPEDWEMVELHATFLEINLMNQIRAVPNPATNHHHHHHHPLTLHLSPTSTANVKVLSLEPALPPDALFAKVAPDAEVIVAPKTRPKPARNSRENRSVTSTSKKSGTSTARGGGSKSRGGEERRPALFLRAVDRALCDEWFDDEDDGDDAADTADNGLAVWVDRDLLVPNEFRGLKYAALTLMRPGADARKQPQSPLQGEASAAPAGAGAGAGASASASAGVGAGAATAAASGAPASIEPATRLVVQLRAWDDPPNGQTAALSPALCAALGCPGIAGGVVKIEPAAQPLPPKLVQKIRIYPFDDGSSTKQAPAALRFGGDSQQDKEEGIKRIKALYGGGGRAAQGLFQGPLTDGLVLGAPPGGSNDGSAGSSAATAGWAGGLVKLSVAPTDGGPTATPKWILGSTTAAGSVAFEVQAAIPKPSWLREAEAQAAVQAGLAAEPALVGIDGVLAGLQTHLAHASSVLLTGALGAGKTSVAQHVGAQLKRRGFFHVTYLPCRKLVNEESRMATIKDTLGRLFMAASWGARLGGQALVILDDLDRLCPAETELVVQSEEGRSRQVSEAVCALARQYCGRDSGVVLLATAQGKDSLHNVVVGGHVVREIVELKAPNKDARRKIMENFARQNAVDAATAAAAAASAAAAAAAARKRDASSSRPTTADGRPRSDDGYGGGQNDENNWMDGASQASGPARGADEEGAFVLQEDLDFLDIAGETDGFMPGDLSQLVARAKNEALVRSISGASGSSGSSSDDTADGSADTVALGREDFGRALRGFTPTSLRNVTLQHSTTTFAAIGGLAETRRVLLETLEYPTKYAPIFAQCPLRLRSGLLLYGFPGCGKTLLASAVAGECGLNFISVKGPEILNKYIGASEKSVRDLFERAQAARPCVLFFDEFDSIAPKRGHDSTGVTDRVVNQLLTQMDGAEGLSGVYVLAATSRPDLIDPALLRPGRLDKSLLCDFPSAADRIDIFRALAKKAKVGAAVLDAPDAPQTLATLARRTEGFSGADLQALVSNAQLEAIHDVLKDRPGTETEPDQQQPAEAGGSGSGSGSRGRGAGAKRTTSGKASASSSSSFVSFRYGYEDAAAAAGTAAALSSRGAALAERAAIAAKLEQLKLARRRERAAKRGGALAGGRQDQHAATAAAGGDDGVSSRDVVIQWKHIDKALAATRASISAEERRRLERIYHEFVVGRSGEMRDGQGSMEVGGRTSLM